MTSWWSCWHTDLGSGYFGDDLDGTVIRSVVLHRGDEVIVVSGGVAEAELLRVAGSLAPIDLRTQPLVLEDLPDR